MVRIGPALVLALLVVAPALVDRTGAAAPAADYDLHLTVDVQPDRSERLTLDIGIRAADGRFERLFLTRGAVPVRVVDAWGEVAFEQGEDGKRTWISFETRAPTVRVDMTRAPPDADSHPLYVRSVGQRPIGDAALAVTITLRVPDGHRIFYASPPTVVSDDARHAIVHADGRVYVRYGYEAPLLPGSGLIAVDEPPFRMFVPAGHEAPARAVARVAAPLVEQSAEGAGLRVPWDRVNVRFAPARASEWQMGAYHGANVITLRASALDARPENGFPFVPARSLVHEAFHALSVPDGRGAFRENVSWFVEGSAVHAQGLVAAAYPESARYCARNGDCWAFDHRLPFKDLAVRYAERSWAFNASWSPLANQSQASRDFHYAYAGFLVDAYVHRFGEDAYRRVWDRLTSAIADRSACGPCDTAWLADALIHEAGGDVTENELYHPYRALFLEDVHAFRERTRDLLANDPVPLPSRPRPGWHADPAAVTATRGLAFEGLDGPLLVGVLLVGMAFAGVLSARARRGGRHVVARPASYCEAGHHVPRALHDCPTCGRARRKE